MLVVQGIHIKIETGTAGNGGRGTQIGMKGVMMIAFDNAFWINGSAQKGHENIVTVAIETLKFIIAQRQGGYVNGQTSGQGALLMRGG